jgi:hypothetical protein
MVHRIFVRVTTTRSIHRNKQIREGDVVKAPEISSRKGKKATNVCLPPCIAWSVSVTLISFSTWKDVTDVGAIPFGVVIIEVKPLGSPKHHEPGFLGPDWRREGANVPDSAGLTLNQP